jgi:hypothetical protein
MSDPTDPVDSQQPVAPDSTETSVSLEAFNAMKAQLHSRNQELADARAQGKVFEERERQRVGGWQSDVKELLQEFMDRGDPELKADVAPLEPWASEYSNKQDIIAQRPLARVMCEASKTIKRVREEASVNKDAALALSNTMKELDGIKGERDNLKQRLDEMSKLADERQDGMLKLQEELTKAGLLSDKHDFSKILNREKPVSEAVSSVIASTRAEHKPVEAEAGVIVETTQASRGTTRANPFESDPLLAMCLRGQGNSRIFHSGTNHHLLGNNGNAGDVMAGLRAY